MASISPGAAGGARIPIGARAARAQVSFKQWVEAKGAPWAAGGMIVGLVLRSAQVWSFGAVRISALPAILQTLFYAATGVSIALGMELLMGAAGAKWYKFREQAIDAEFDTSVSPKLRIQNAKKMRSRSQLFMYFAGIGALASISAGVVFALSNAGASLASVVEDIATMAVITAGVFFFTVIYEPEEADPMKAAQDAINAQLHESAANVAVKVGAGTHTPADLDFLAQMASGDMSRKLDALRPRESGVEYWDAPKIVKWLGLESDAAARNVRRVLAKARDNKALGIREKRKGPGLEAPTTAILTLFQEHIESRMNGSSALVSERQSTAPLSEPVLTAASAAGQPAVKPRRTTGPRQRRETAARQASLQLPYPPEWRKAKRAPANVASAAESAPEQPADAEMLTALVAE